MSRHGLAVVVATALSLSLTARAEVLPTQGRVDERIRTAVYSADQVYRLYGYVGYHIDLEFEADETFAALSGGGRVGRIHNDHGIDVTPKPKYAITPQQHAVTNTQY